MHPSKVDRAQLRRLTDLPNVGPACAQDLQVLGIHDPAQLRDCDAFEMHAMPGSANAPACGTTRA